MQVLQIKCPNCGSDLEMNMDKLMAFCPYCRAKLPLDVNVEHVVSEKERTKRKEMEEETKRIVSEHKSDSDHMGWIAILTIVCIIASIVILKMVA